MKNVWAVVHPNKGWDCVIMVFCTKHAAKQYAAKQSYAAKVSKHKVRT